MECESFHKLIETQKRWSQIKGQKRPSEKLVVGRHDPDRATGSADIY